VKLKAETYMRRVIELARQKAAFPFAALIVNDKTGEVMAEGWNRSRTNPVLHGEVDAISRCAARSGDADWSNLVIYTTAEPCPMCMGTILWTGIGRAVYGTSIPTLMELGWAQIDIRAEDSAQRAAFSQCQIIGGVLESECNALFTRCALLPQVTEDPVVSVESGEGEIDLWF